MTVTTVVFDRVRSRDSRVGLGLGSGLECYQAAQWGCFTFGMVGALHCFCLPYVDAYYRALFFRWDAATLLAIVFFRGVGVVGRKEKKTSSQDGSL